MAEDKAKALNQAYKINLILRDEERPHLINETSAVVLDLTELAKEKLGASEGGDTAANRIIGVQEIYSKDFPDGSISPLFHGGFGLEPLRRRIENIIRASIVNEKQYEAIMGMVGQAFRDEYDRRHDYCRDIIKESSRER